MEVSGVFTSSNGQCPIASHSLDAAAKDWAVATDSGASGFTVARKETDRDKVSDDDERSFTITASAEGGASTSATYEMRIVDDPALTSAGIAAIILGVLLGVVVLGAVVMMTCCGNGAESVAFEDEVRRIDMDDQNGNGHADAPKALVPGGS